ncbi:MAG: DUF1330 domain-containing protein [Novosphingobium sp.]
MTAYLEPTQVSGRAFFMRGIQGPVLMLNLLRFRENADYSAAPHLAPPEPISGAEAYALYAEHTMPFLKASGGEVVLEGDGGGWLIGPEDEHWDKVLLVRQASTEAMMAFPDDAAYMAGLAHRTAALADSRLLPIAPLGQAGAVTPP